MGGKMTALIVYETLAVIVLLSMLVVEMTESQARMELSSSRERGRK